jgi:TPR repeat protein
MVTMRWVAAAVAAMMAILPASAFAGFDEGLRAFREKDYATAYKEFELLAASGHAQAQNNLGLMYQAGAGVEKDEALALSWFRKAADQGLATAQYNLGILLERPGHDPVEANDWLRKAALQGHAGGRLELARRHEKGEGTGADLAEALRWAILAVDTARGKQKETATAYRDGLIARMSNDDIVRGQQLAEETPKQ